MSKQVSHQTLFRRLMLRSELQSLFWHVLLVRKREMKFTLKALADKLGINRSYVTRSFSSPPNWTVDKLSDMADALQIDLIVEARDRLNGRIYTPSGGTSAAATETRRIPGAAEALLPMTGSDFVVGPEILIRETA